MSSYDIVVLSGGFDPPHVGHVRMVQDAASKCERVIVGVNSDEWLMRKKGYVFMPHEERIEMMSAIKNVFDVIVFDDDDNTANELINLVHKAYADSNIAFGNGGDRTTKNTPEQENCNEKGIDMIWGIGGDYKAQSSSTLVENSRQKR